MTCQLYVRVHKINVTFQYEVDKVKHKRSIKPRPKTAHTAELGVIDAASKAKQSNFIHAIDMPIFHTQTFHNQFL